MSIYGPVALETIYFFLKISELLTFKKGSSIYHKTRGAFKVGGLLLLSFSLPIVSLVNTTASVKKKLMPHVCNDSNIIKMLLRKYGVLTGCLTSPTTTMNASLWIASIHLSFLQENTLFTKS